MPTTWEGDLEMPKSRYDRRRRWSLCFSACCMLVVSACGGAEPQGGSAETGMPRSGSGAPAAAPANEKAEPLGKYDPPIEISTVRSVSPAWKFPDGDSIDNNVWYRDFESELGIKVKNEWSVPGGQQFEQKMNVTLASGDLPDLIPVNASQLKKLIDTKQVADLTDVFDRYATPLTKGILNQDGGLQMKSASQKDRLMALPKTAAPINEAPLVWIRTDWLNKLNLTMPTTLGELLAVAEAFAKRDPDGNGKADTFGIAVNKDLWGGLASLEGFFNAYHAYPNIWTRNAAGRLQFGSIQPEMKTALKKLQEMYKDGQIDKEFGVKDANKVNEFIASGKIGVWFGGPANTSIQKYRDVDKNADWQAIPLVSVDSQPAKSQIDVGVTTYYAVHKNAKNPEAVVKMFNRWFEKMWGETAEPLKYAKSEDGIYQFNAWSPVDPRPYRKNLDAYLNVTDALTTNNAAKLNPEELDYYNRAVNFAKGQDKFFGYTRIFGENGSFGVIDQYMKEQRLLTNEFYGSATPSMVTKQATLEKLQLTAFTKIILNAAPIDEFDKFVDDWKKLGGDDITREVNEWYADSK